MCIPYNHFPGSTTDDTVAAIVLVCFNKAMTKFISISEKIRLKTIKPSHHKNHYFTQNNHSKIMSSLRLLIFTHFCQKEGSWSPTPACGCGAYLWRKAFWELKQNKTLNFPVRNIFGESRESSKCIISSLFPAL